MSFEILANQQVSNRYESLAATIGPRLRELRKAHIRESLGGLKQVPHKLEPVATIQGVEFVNDSFSSTTNATWYALDNYNRPIIWIAGGVDSKADFASLSELVKAKVKAIVCLGVSNKRVRGAFAKLGIPIVETSTMEDAVISAYRAAERNDLVLLSPACPSFDLFENYEARGLAFRSAVKNL